MSNCIFSDYDIWKTTPDDFYEPDEPVCDHEEYDVNWEGRATCDICRAHWWLTPEEHECYDKYQQEWQERYDRRMRRESAWWYRAWRWLLSLNPWRHTGYPYGPAPDDEIPF